MGGKKSSKARGVSVEPGFEGEPSGESGRGGTTNSLSSGSREDQLVRDQLGEGGGGEEHGCESMIWTGT